MDVKELFYISKKDQNQYEKDITLLCYVIIHEQGRVLYEDIIEKEEEKSSSELDTKLGLNKDPYLY